MRLFGKKQSFGIGRKITDQIGWGRKTSTTCPVRATSPRREYRRGFTGALSLLLGVMPFGLIYGALAVAADFSPAAVMTMSATVFAGSAQFLAVGLYAAHTSPVAIVLATFIINLRHLLYGITLGQQYRGVSSWLLPPLAFTTTDEVFVLVQARLQHLGQNVQSSDHARRLDTNHAVTQHLHWFALGTATVLYLGWQLATWLGVAGGQLIGDPTALGLEFALPATFIAFLMPQLSNRPAVVCALIAGLSALLLQGLPLQSGLIAAIVLGVAAAIGVEARQTKPETERTA